MMAVLSMVPSSSCARSVPVAARKNDMASNFFTSERVVAQAQLRTESECGVVATDNVDEKSVQFYTESETGQGWVGRNSSAQIQLLDEVIFKSHPERGAVINILHSFYRDK